MERFVVELSSKQLDELLSNKVSLMTPVIDYIRNNVEDKETYVENNYNYPDKEW